MTPTEALDLLHRVKVTLLGMGLAAQAGEVEHAEELLGTAHRPARVAHELAAKMLPPGRRGRVCLLLRRPAEARALALVAAVLRAVR